MLTTVLANKLGQSC